MDPQDAAAELKKKGNAEFQKGNYVKAINLYTSALASRQDVTFYSNRAMCYLKLSKFRECINDCNAAINIDPKFAKAYGRRGQAQLALGEIDSAVISYRQAYDIEGNENTLKKNAEEAEMLQSFAKEMQECEKEEKWSDALRKCEMILEKCTQAVKWELKRIELWNKNGDYEKSVNKMKELGHEYSNNSLFNFLKGQTFYYSGKTDVGKKIWREVLQSDPDMTLAQAALKNIKKCEDGKEKGNAEFKSGKLDDALKTYNETMA